MKICHPAKAGFPKYFWSRKTIQLHCFISTFSIPCIQSGKSLVRSQMVSLVFFIDIKSFRSHYGPGVDSASNRNEYQEYFLGGKDGRCLGLRNLPTSCPDCLAIWETHPSGTLRAAVQACNGIALPLPLPFFIFLY